MKNKKAARYLALITAFSAAAYLIIGIQRVAVEKLGISSGTGYDIEKSVNGDFTYSIPLSVYIISENKAKSKVYTGKGPTIGDTRQDRQRKFDKRFLLGFEKVYIFSEDYAIEGIKTAVDILFNNQFVNDTGFVCVCKGKSEHLLSMNLEGYPSSADFIDGLIRSSSGFNFFPKNYKILDMYVRVDAEGRCVALPYVEVDNNQIQITGVAVFKKDKMAFKLDMHDAKLLNILKEDMTMGVIDIQNSTKDYANFTMTTKRHVNCYKEGNKYRFVINIDMQGDVTTNELYKYDEKINLGKSQKELEETISRNMEEELSRFIEKMKNEYKMDCLELGRVAAAKYGREDNRKWDDIVCKSEIEVKVKAKIDRTGRGDY